MRNWFVTGYNIQYDLCEVVCRYCDIFPSINIKGTVKHLQLLPHELEDYEKQVEKVLKRYLKRLQWLLSGM